MSDLLYFTLENFVLSIGRLNNLVVNFIISSSIPFSVVENNDFKDIIKLGFPKKSLMCRSTLMKYINKKSDYIVSNLKETLDSVKYVTTTVDCWSIFKKYVYN